MAEPMDQKRAGLLGRAGRTLGSMWLWLQCALYSRNMLGSVGRVLKMIFTGRFGLLVEKIRQLRSADHALSAYKRPAGVVRTGPPLHLAGNIHGHGGYDHLVLKALIGLTDAGVHVFRDKRSFMDSAFVPPAFAPSERMYDWRGPRLAIIPPHILHLYKPTETTAAWTMWETDTLPDGSVKHLNRCGLLLIPSRWGVDCFRANGVTVPMEVVSLGYDPAVFSPRLGGSGPEICTFGTAGALDEGGLRKNVQRVIDLFLQTFPGRADVRLKVKITPRSPMVDTHGDPRVEVVNTGLAPAALADWYRSLTCYVNASYGEGFGLHLLEAMGCGVPLISTTFSAVGAVFDSRVGYEIGYKLIEAKNKIYSGLWADPDNDQLVERMREVYADRATAERFGLAAAARAPAFSWDASIRNLTAALAKYGYLPPEFAREEKRAAA
ncbi:MAG: glycosyltransferase family 4 protein [Planctomycetes bacterium]|nr:glycosyltransferase family 4 protein [Planctomycetota bacterium]